jgi:asparaginyl-tRNA synthetase
LRSPSSSHTSRKQAKAFYHMPDPSNPSITLSADLLAPKGYGEVVGGGQRIHDYGLLLRRIEEEGLDPADYKWYLDLRKIWERAPQRFWAWC